MNKLLTTLAILFLSFGVLQAQYVRVNKDFKDRGIQFYENEIYKLDTKIGNKKEFFADTIKCSAFSDVTEISSIDADKTGEKNIFVKRGANDMLHIDLSSITISESAPVRLVGDKTISILHNKVTTISSIGDKFRLIIPNTITIWYDKNQLEEYMPPETEKEPFIEEPYESSVKKNALVSYIQQYWIIMSVLILIGGAIGYFLPKLFIKRDKKEQENKNTSYLIEVFDGSHLKNWTISQDITIERLVQLNPEYKYIWGKIKKENTNWSAIQEQLKDKVLKIKETEQSPTNGINEVKESSIIQELNEIKKKIDALGSKDDSDELKKEITRLEITLKQREKELTQKEEDIQFYKLEEKNKQALHAKTVKTILYVDDVDDSWKIFAGRVYDYLKYCREEVYRSAIKLYNDLQQSEKAGMLLLNFEIATESLRPDKWLQILSEIKEKGVIVTSNQDIIKSFQQLPNEDDKFREFKRFIFNEFLLKYSSSLLILAEAFRNLDRFGINIDNSWKSKFDVFVKDIQEKSKSVEMTIKYVPLFENIENYSSSVTYFGTDVSRAYENVGGVKDDYIAEIISYGIETELGKSDILTKVILKK